MDFMIDESILQDCLAGTRKAQRDLYEACYVNLFYVCERYKHNHVDAEDLFNQAFLKIILKLNSYDTSRNIRTWCKRIIINTCIDDFRKHKSFRERFDFTDDISRYEESPSLLNSHHTQLDEEVLMEMISKLPEMTQKVFNLYGIDGYSHKEIGALLDMSLGTSKWHLHNARTKLQAMILEKTDRRKVSGYEK